MVKFGKYISILVLLLVCVITPLEVFVRTLDNPYKTKDRYINQNGDSIKTLILGASDAYYGINPEYMNEGTFNLSNLSQSVHYDRFLLAKYGDRFKSLKTLVYPVSAITFFNNPEMGGSWAYNYRIYLGCDEHSYFSKYNWEFCRPEILVGKLESAIRGSVRTCSSLGFGSDYALKYKVPANREVTTSKEKALGHTIKNWQYYDADINDFVWILDYCKNHSIQVVLLRIPYYKDYIEALPQKQLDKINKAIDSLSNVYQFTLLDHLQDPRMQPDDFFDCLHLSDVGAKKFSTILQEDLNNL
jgi:hypothetical protein